MVKKFRLELDNSDEVLFEGNRRQFIDFIENEVHKDSEEHVSMTLTECIEYCRGKEYLNLIMS